MTAEANALAVIAAINATATTGVIAYDIDEIPGAYGHAGTLPAKYVEVTVSRRFGGEMRGSGSVAMLTLYRVTTRAVAKDVTSARNLRRLTTLALEDVSLTVDGTTTSPVMFESEEPIGPDEGWYSGLTTWIYSI